MPARHQSLCRLPKPAAFAGAPRIVLPCEDPAQHALTIRFQDWQSGIESLREDGAHRVTANAGQLSRGSQIAWKNSMVFFDNGLGGPVHIASAAIVAQPFPK